MKTVGYALWFNNVDDLVCRAPCAVPVLFVVSSLPRFVFDCSTPSVADDLQVFFLFFWFFSLAGSESQGFLMLVCGTLRGFHRCGCHVWVWVGVMRGCVGVCTKCLMRGKESLRHHRNQQHTTGPVPIHQHNVLVYVCGHT